MRMNEIAKNISSYYEQISFFKDLKDDGVTAAIAINR